MKAVGLFRDAQLARLAERAVEGVGGFSLEATDNRDVFVTMLIDGGAPVGVIGPSVLEYFAELRAMIAARGGAEPVWVLGSSTPIGADFEAQATAAGIKFCYDMSEPQWRTRLFDLVGALSRTIPASADDAIHVVFGYSDPHRGAAMSQLLRADSQIAVVGECNEPVDFARIVRDTKPAVGIIGAQWVEQFTRAKALLAETDNPEPVWLLATLVKNPRLWNRAEQAGIPYVYTVENFSSRQAIGRCVLDITEGADNARERHSIQRRLDDTFSIANDQADREIMLLVLEGLTNEQIAETIHLSLQTVKNRMTRLMKAAGASNRTQFAVDLRDK